MTDPADVDAALAFSPPSGFEVAEVMVSLRGPDPAALREPRALQPQFPVRPNLIVHRKPAPDGAEVGLITGEICAELLTTIEGLQNLHTESFAFADHVEGSLVSFDFPAGKAMTVRQYQAVRVDEGALWTMTLTVDASTLDAATWERYGASLRSLGVDPAPNPTTNG